MESTTTTTAASTATPAPRVAATDTNTSPSPTLHNAMNGQLSYVKSLVDLIRVRHWVKNLFLFIPSFFAGHLFKSEELLMVATGALAFSLVASAVYVINDYRDRFVDRLHPTKKLRPLASGEVGSAAAWILIGALAASGFILAAALNTGFFYLLLAYFVMNLGYSFGLKNIPILDLFLVSLGFLLRVYSGGMIADLPITHWLSIMILLLALFLIVAKRRDDLLINEKNGCVIRKSTETYNLDFVNSCI
ncbi:MAG TPA: UbiA family prenyltransferase, partial [Chryseosolibacter sp.]